ncbi:uncharacterized protein LOC130747971 [Lotus japonicus]|uniref:uncharacterized protein LOC130747971 n=1 Tax=Lotus japonicus TaxID=34305 RepID=UPI002587BE88|nr:uncharacterized protein LOC130747971 [Lotus japonicus]
MDLGKISIPSGGVIRDHHDRWVIGCYSRVDGGNAFKAEALALRGVLQLAWDKGFRQVICDVDCVDLVKIVVDPEAVQLHTEFLVLYSIRQLISMEWDVKLNDVHRDSNAIADYLAWRGAATGLWVRLRIRFGC